MADARDYSERRDFIRMFIDATVNFRLPGNPELHSGKSRNLSGSGLLFSSPMELQPDQLIEFKLGSAQSKVAPLEGEARVVRAKPGEAGCYEIAAEITRLL